MSFAIFLLVSSATDLHRCLTCSTPIKRNTRPMRDIVAYWHFLSIYPGGIFESWEKLGGQSLIGKDGMKRVLPVGKSLWDWSVKTSVMGILNVTLDSFSDGGKYQFVEDVVSQARLMISQGADIIDIGAQSTRPMASRISPEEEHDRLIPVLKAI
ncbi:hypothetical protein POM88_041729 [Heracleum sosnowskyi]|uniref:Pterin-binding domain-containing protein n=1 Tax=Heracleum sosnowskyi TaxID=360622 RepID=A0AAD8MBL8_9APIA|nr:hypothetical protein POM88_041729 [Heracleum sosnowskyi]